MEVQEDDMEVQEEAVWDKTFETSQRRPKTDSN